MSDELKNKSGKVKVMYVRSDDDSDKRTHNPRTGKGGGRPENLVLTAAAALRVTNETAAAMIANVTTVSVTSANAMIFIATMRLRGVPFPALGDETPVKKITAGSAGRALSIRKCCVVSVRKRPAYMAKTPAVRCSRAVRKLSFAPGFIQSVTPRF